MRILVSWVGHMDLRCCAQNSPATSGNKEAITAYFGGPPRIPLGLGPVHTLVAQVPFDAFYLLSDAPCDISERFAAWLPCDPIVEEVEIGDPTDYAAVYAIVDSLLSRIRDEHATSMAELCFHLSPGTPAMTAIWVLLGKSLYPATFYQTFDGQVKRTEIPFDISVDVIPELLKHADSNLQALAARPPADVPGFEAIAGNSQAIRLAVGRARQAAIRDVPILLLGESGTGKEMFASGIHVSSNRRAKPFLTINCAAIPANLLESELFGHVKGAFSGAYTAHKGAFERAHGGTLFLDEVGECPPDMQAKLLRVLQPPAGRPPCTRVFRPIGGDQDLTTDVRVIAATNRDLHGMIRDGHFLEDLYYRLAVISVRLPALRARRTDIPVIADRLLAQVNRDFALSEPGYQEKHFSPDAKKFTLDHPWPGNVRQLYNAILQAAVMTTGTRIDAPALRQAVAEMPGAQEGTLADPLDHPLGDGFDLEDHLKAIQRRYLTRAMREADGKKTKAAELLGYPNYQRLSKQLEALSVEWQADDD